MTFRKITGATCLLLGLLAVTPAALAQSTDGGTNQVPAPGVLALLAIGGVAAAGAVWRNRRK